MSYWKCDFHFSFLTNIEGLSSIFLFSFNKEHFLWRFCFLMDKYVVFTGSLLEQLCLKKFDSELITIYHYLRYCWIKDYWWTYTTEILSAATSILILILLLTSISGRVYEKFHSLDCERVWTGGAGCFCFDFKLHLYVMHGLLCPQYSSSPRLK